jgi:hypothetical protein
MINRKYMTGLVVGALSLTGLASKANAQVSTTPIVLPPFVTTATQLNFGNIYYSLGNVGGRGISVNFNTTSVSGHSSLVNPPQAIRNIIGHLTMQTGVYQFANIFIADPAAVALWNQAIAVQSTLAQYMSVGFGILVGLVPFPGGGNIVAGAGTSVQLLFSGPTLPTIGVGDMVLVLSTYTNNPGPTEYQNVEVIQNGNLLPGSDEANLAAWMAASAVSMLDTYNPGSYDYYLFGYGAPNSLSPGREPRY